MKKSLLVLIFVLSGIVSAQWYNLQWPPNATITEGDSVNVYAQIWVDGVTTPAGQGADILAWIGVFSSDTDPETWPDSAWEPATYNGDNGANDEYTAAIGSNLSAGTYYYASRFLYQTPSTAKEGDNISVSYWYGGFDGGPWDGTNNVSGVLTVNAEPTIGWANLQWPPTASILEGDSVDVYAQVWMEGVTDVGSPGTGISAWIGVHNENINPASWPNEAWKPAVFNADVGNNDEYTAAIGSNLTEGTYYYASRFLYQAPSSLKDGGKITGEANYYYGGFQGGAWDSTNNVSGVLTVSSVPDTVIDWANLQWPPQVNLINEFQFTVYGQIYEAGVTDDSGKGAGIEAWFGINEENTDPSTWSDSNWVAGSYNVDVGNNDEYMADLNLAQLLRHGSEFNLPNNFYYAARYRLNGGEFYYGGFQGGAWDGTNNVNGEGTFEFNSFSSIGWCNLQWPPTMTLDPGQSGTVYAQFWVNGLTDAPGPASGFNVYIGVYNENTNPETWPQSAWYPATYNTDVGNNDEYMAEIGSDLNQGTYYYASKFVAGGIKSFYGGYNPGGGGFWDGVDNISGILTIGNVGPAVDWCNLQWPPDGTIHEGEEFMVYAQAWIADVTNLEGATPGLSAWIGINDENSNPADWPEEAWLSADFNVDAGNNDEFWLDIGSNLPVGIYYYASRFQLEGGPFSYGGYNEGGGGFWDGIDNISGMLEVSPILSVEDEIPTEFALDQNYPNPFNPTTKIRFSVPTQSNVKIKVYNIMGEEVALLNNGLSQPGIHEINWNAGNLASGIYLLRIQAAATDNSKEFIDMKKMILMK